MYMSYGGVCMHACLELEDARPEKGLFPSPNVDRQALPLSKFYYYYFCARWSYIVIIF